MEKKNLTINDIAKAAGVSKTTVSRYLNGKTELISSETVNRIESIIGLTGYRPNATAQYLKSRKSMMIGVTIADIFSPFSAALMIGISDVLDKVGYQPLFVNCKEARENERELVKSLTARGVDGLLVNTVSYENPYLIELACNGMPIVLCDRYVKDYNFDIATNSLCDLFPQVLKHIKEQGFKPPVLFTQSYSNNSTRITRIDSFCRVLSEVFSVKNPEAYVVQIDMDNGEDTQKKLMKLLKESPTDKPPCVIGVNTVTTMNLLTQIKDLNLKIPNDIGICGPDDWSWKKHIDIYQIISPGISSMVFYATELGKQAANLLVKRIQNPDMPKQIVTIPSEFIIRNSTILNH